MKLVLAGAQGWYYTEIFRTVETLGLTEQVIFPGFIPGDELPDWYAAAEVFVYPSLFEGFGLPVLEAMACATPVVASPQAASALGAVAGSDYLRGDNPQEFADALLALANANVLPVLPAKGSVGPSGDLAPLAHLALVLIGEGECDTPEGARVSGAEAMRRAGFAPFVLGPKEGLALLNGTQVSTALALYGLFGAESVFVAGLMARTAFSTGITSALSGAMLNCPICGSVPPGARSQ